MTSAQIFFGFEGRLDRMSYFGHSLLAAVISGLAGLVGLALFTTTFGMVFGIALMLIAVVGLVWTNLALTAKRLHDMGLSSLNMLWIEAMGLNNLVASANPSWLSIVGSVMLLLVSLWILLCPSEPDNRFGPAPIKPAA